MSLEIKRKLTIGLFVILVIIIATNSYYIWIIVNNLQHNKWIDNSYIVNVTIINKYNNILIVNIENLHTNYTIMLCEKYYLMKNRCINGKYDINSNIEVNYNSDSNDVDLNPVKSDITLNIVIFTLINSIFIISSICVYIIYRYINKLKELKDNNVELDIQTVDINL